MALKQITAKDFKDAVSSLTNGYTCWHKLLGRTDAGTELVFVIGWSDAGYDEDDAKKNGYADGRYTICSKIACQFRYNGSQSDYDGDFEMPYDKETGDVWDTDTMVSNNESDWETDAATYNKDAQAIWDTYCVPDEDGFTALDALFESKKSSEEKKHTCSMQKKKESLSAKKPKKCEAYNWIAFYFCKDKRTGTEYAVIPQDRVFVVGNGGGRYNLSYLDANGHWDRLSYGYFATSCEPISNPENSKVYAAVKADEDRRIIALTESEFDTIVEADDAVKMVKSIVANNYESKKSEATLDAYRKRAKELGGKLRIRSNSLGKFGEIMLGDTGYSTMGSVFTKELLDKYKPLFDLHREMANDPDIKAMGIIINESKKSESLTDKDKKDDKSCKGKDCKDGKQTETREKPQEGPGAGYTVTIKGMTISDEPKISKDGDKYIVEAPVEYEADAEGYDWSSAYIMNELVGTDEGTFPHNPFKGVLTMEVKDSPDIWGAMQNSFFADRDNPTEEEKMEIITDVFHKGATFNDFEQSYGGGYSHSKFVSEDGVCMQADYYGFNDIDFGSESDGYIGGTLTIDDRFIEDIEFASDYGYNRYKLVEAIQQFVKGRGLEMDWSEDTLYDYVAPYVTSDEITDDYVKEILSDMVDSGVEFTDADGNPADLQLESIQGESKKSEGISDMIDAKIDYNMFMRMCKTAAYLEEDEDYWDALWEYYSDLGSIGDALVFFDNLFQYTSWKTAKDLWTDYSNILGDKPEGKDYEEALDAYLDENDNEVGNSAVYKYGDHYLMLH